MLKSACKNPSDSKILEFNQIFSCITEPINEDLILSKVYRLYYISKKYTYQELSIRCDLGYPAFWSVCTLYKKN